MRFKVRSVDRIIKPTRKDTTLTTIVAGGQQGVDIAALRAARKQKIATAGSIPKGYQTLEGNKPGYSWLYKLNDDSNGYEERIWKNVAQSNAVIRIGNCFCNDREGWALEAVRYYQKLLLDVFLVGDRPEPGYEETQPREVAQWIVANRISVLNITGTADKDLELQVEAYLLEVFNILLWE